MKIVEKRSLICTGMPKLGIKVQHDQENFIHLAVHKIQPFIADPTFGLSMDMKIISNYFQAF